MEINTENVIEYIKRSSALRFKMSYFWLELFYMPVISFGFMMMGKMVGGFCYASGIGAAVMCIAHFVALILFGRRSSPIKNKYIINFTSSSNMFFILAVLYTAVHYELNLPEKNLISSFVLSVFVPFFLAVLFSKMLKRPETVFRKITKITYTSVSYYVAGTAAAERFFVGFVIKEYGHIVGERTLYLGAMYILMFGMFVMSANVLDLQRYYYFTRLEKAGLVTEDVLNPEA